MNIQKNRMKKFRRSFSRGVTLVEVLIVVAIMAVISTGAVFIAFPEYRKAQIKTAVVGANAIKSAAEVYINLDMGSAEACPTIQDLVNSKKIDSKKSDDPWGSPFKIHCGEGEVNVTSNGRDKRENTPDDVRDDFKPSDIERVAKL